jgi:hypothetical protein
MTALRVCAGAVSSEQRRSNGSSAAAELVRRADAVTIAAADATNLRRDHDCMFILLFPC